MKHALYTNKQGISVERKIRMNEVPFIEKHFSPELSKERSHSLSFTEVIMTWDIYSDIVRVLNVGFCSYFIL